ncbi:MAG: Fic family protein [Bacteroidota bacterium]
MEENQQVYRLWQPIKYSEIWKECDTSILDDISASWFKRRLILKENSSEYNDFLNRLKREHAIETGVIERLYDLDKGITETFIKEGFVKSYLSHGDTDIPKSELMNHLNDHLDAVNFIFDVVKENRHLTTGFIKELHHLVTQHQKYAERRDQFGNKLQIPLLKGTYKVRENNPTQDDGTRILYAPPEHVASEMDNLAGIYNDLVDNNVHPLLVSSWFHHAFTTIHPFQDGNGRVARLLASLIFIKFGYFPVTVLREEAKVRYIESLEQADKGAPQLLVTYFGEIQKRNIQKALNIREVSSTSLEEVQQIFARKIENWQLQKEEAYQNLLKENRMQVFKYCSDVLNELRDQIQNQLNGGVAINISSCSFDRQDRQYYFDQQIVRYASKYDYFFNRTLPKSWITYGIELSENKKYQLGISIHHYGYDDTTLAISSFLEYKAERQDEQLDVTLPLDIPPHVISIDDNIEGKKKNIRTYIENVMTSTLAQIASEIN